MPNEATAVQRSTEVVVHQDNSPLKVSEAGMKAAIEFAGFDPREAEKVEDLRKYADKIADTLATAKPEERRECLTNLLNFFSALQNVAYEPIKYLQEIGQQQIKDKVFDTALEQIQAFCDLANKINPAQALQPPSLLRKILSKIVPISSAAEQVLARFQQHANEFVKLDETLGKCIARVETLQEESAIELQSTDTAAGRLEQIIKFTKLLQERLVEKFPEPEEQNLPDNGYRKALLKGLESVIYASQESRLMFVDQVRELGSVLEAFTDRRIEIIQAKNSGVPMLVTATNRVNRLHADEKARQVKKNLFGVTNKYRQQGNAMIEREIQEAKKALLEVQAYQEDPQGYIDSFPSRNIETTGDQILDLIVSVHHRERAQTKLEEVKKVQEVAVRQLGDHAERLSNEINKKNAGFRELAEQFVLNKTQA